jgi:glycosyltransferase involved in cell wall biosynthesis
MMKSMKSLGYEVLAVGQESESKWESRFKENGIPYKQVFLERNGLNPIKDLKSFIQIYKCFKEYKPDKLFLYQAKPVVYGAISAKLLGISEVYSLIAGLGSVFNGDTFVDKIVKFIMMVQYYIAFKISKKVFFQNYDNRKEFVDSKLIDDNKIEMMNGSGVNLKYFTPQPLPDQIAFLFISRLIKDKGAIEYLEACRILKNAHPEARCLVVGPYDTNRTAMSEEELQTYISDGTIEYFGEQTDVRPFLKGCSIFVLPSYHEGTPKTVLEAMATARAIITTDAPGCRETVIDNENGFLVPTKDIKTLADRMIYLYNNPNTIKIMGEKGLEICRNKYDVELVNKKLFEVMGLSQREIN